MIFPDTVLDSVVGADDEFSANTLGGPEKLRFGFPAEYPGPLHLLYWPDVTLLIEAMTKSQRNVFADPEFCDCLTSRGYSSMAQAYGELVYDALEYKYRPGFAEWDFDVGVSIFLEHQQGESVQEWYTRIGKEVMHVLSATAVDVASRMR